MVRSHIQVIVQAMALFILVLDIKYTILLVPQDITKVLLMK